MTNRNNLSNKLKPRPLYQVPNPINIETVQQSIPIVGVHEKYDLIETYRGCYVKSYLIGDNNYLTAPEDEQAQMFLGWRKVLNSFGTNMEFAVTINNRKINQDDFRESILMKEVGDKYDPLRKELNQVVMERMTDGRNSIQKDKYLTVGVHTEGPAKAAAVFERLDREIDKSMAKVGSYAHVIPIEERLEILYGIYNDPTEHFLSKTRVIDENGKTKTVRSFDYKNMRQEGLSINSLICPDSMQISRDHMMFGGKYVRALKIYQMPSQMSDEFITNVTDMPFNCITTINFKAIPAKKADAMVAKNLSLVRDAKAKQIKQGQRQGIYDESYVSPELLDREAEALALRDDMHERDEKLFETTVSVVVFAESMEALNANTESIISEYKKGSAVLNTMINMQTEGFNTTLPLCYNQIIEKRTLKSSSGAIMHPFSILELNDPGGINYSCNLLSKNLIVYDRLTAANYNGFILGTPGSGKSFTAKLEMLNVFLKTNADIIVIDPEDEYTGLAKMLDGEVVKVTPGGDNHINPMEIAAEYELDDETDPINAKADFILKICECIIKSPFGINSVQETIIDECVHSLFDRFVDPATGRLGKIKPEDMPTLTDLQRILESRKEAEARELAIALKLYTGNGSLNVFGTQTNVNVSQRFVVYQIKDIGDRLKSLSMLAILDHIWNQIVQNRKIGKQTWFYIDEIYLLFQNEYSASFLDTLFRRARKYLGVPTGITQNCISLLNTDTGCSMLQNSSLLQILNMSGPDRERLREILNLSDQQIDVITNAPKGQGLFCNSRQVIPFYSVFPKNTECYRVLTSDRKEIAQYEAEARREASRKIQEEV